MSDIAPKKSGRAAGGVARAAKLTSERRSAIARNAAVKRHGLKATHRGNFKAELGVDVECYVLKDAGKTAVISQTGMAKALGLSSRGNSLPSFIESQAMAPFVGDELSAKLASPLIFQWPGVGGGAPPIVAHGYDATVLIDICNAIAAANAAGKLSKRYDKIIQQAATITGASAKSGIRQFVYALAGYNPSAQEVIAAFKMYVTEEARKYEKEFPPELYAEWHRLYKIHVPRRGKPWEFKTLTLDHIYTPLADSNGKVLKLTRESKDKDGDRRKKLFMFLSEIGTRALRMHLGRVLEMAQSSKTKDEYEGKVAERFGGQLKLALTSD